MLLNIRESVHQHVCLGPHGSCRRRKHQEWVSAKKYTKKIYQVLEFCRVIHCWAERENCVRLIGTCHWE